MSRRQQGFSVVELMVAMTLSLVLLAGVLFVVFTSKVTYNEGERIARLQESGRSAIELMLRDMRASGFRGCTQGVPFRNTLNGANTLLWDFGTVLQGFEASGSGTWTPALDSALIPQALDGSDVIAVRTVRADMPVFVTNAAMASSTSDITVDVDDAEDLPDGRTMLISDCNAASVFAVSSFTRSGTTATLGHASSAEPIGVGPGNESDDLGFRFLAGAQLAPVDTVIYYIRPSDTVRNGTRNPSLWRIIGSAAPEEVIEGVEAMQILYGVDTDGDRLVNTYVAADAVSNWNRVVSVSLSVLIRSLEPNAPEKDTRTYTLLGTTLGPFNDFYERTLYTTTVALRNNTT